VTFNLALAWTTILFSVCAGQSGNCIKGWRRMTLVVVEWADCGCGYGLRISSFPHSLRDVGFAICLCWIRSRPVCSLAERLLFSFVDNSNLRSKLPQIYSSLPRVLVTYQRDPMAARQSISSLARTATPSSLRAHTTQQQRRLVHTHHHAILRSSVFNTAARRRGQAQGLTATFGLQSPKTATAKLIAPSARKYSTERSVPAESKIWDFKEVISDLLIAVGRIACFLRAMLTCLQLSKLMEDTKHKIALIGTSSTYLSVNIPVGYSEV